VYEYRTYTIAANTAETDRTTQELKVSPGILTGLSVYFPPGVHSLARCRISIGETPIAPRSAGGYITGNNSTLPIEGIYELISDKRPVLKIELWNLDYAYSHTIHVTAKWLTEEEMQAERTLLAAIHERIDKLVRSMTGGA
jgi:hypothetical protein